MLLYPFTLSPSAIAALAGPSVAHSRVRIEELRRLWRDSGVLVLDREGRLQGQYESRWEAEGFPPGVRKLLTDVFFELRQRIVKDRKWVAPERHGESGAARPDGGTQVVDEDEACAWGCPSEHPCHIAESGVEICRVDCLPLSRWSELGKSRVLPKQAGTKDVLEGFGPLGAVASVAEVIDPYCGIEEVRTPGRSGLLQALREISGDGERFERRLRTLIIYSAKGVPFSRRDPRLIDGTEIAQAWRGAVSRLSAVGIKTVRLNLVDMDRFSAIAHDRFGSFGDGKGSRADVVFHVGAGFAVFEGKRLSRETTFGPVYADDFRRVARELEAERSLELHELRSDEAPLKSMACT